MNINVHIPQWGRCASNGSSAVLSLILVSGDCVPQRAEHAFYSDADIQHLWRQSVRSCRCHTGPGLWNSLPSHLKDADISYTLQWIPAVAKDISVWTVGPRRSVNLTAPSRNIPTYFTYLLSPRFGRIICVRFVRAQSFRLILWCDGVLCLECVTAELVAVKNRGAEMPRGGGRPGVLS